MPSISDALTSIKNGVVALNNLIPAVKGALNNIAGQLASAGTSIAALVAAVALINSKTYVNSIAGNQGAFTLNGTSGITNTVNDIILSRATAAQFGAVKVDGTTITATAGVISAVPASTSLSFIQASLAADVLINSAGAYFDGPTVAQGTVGTWLVTATVTFIDTAATAVFNAKLWDGTTVIASAQSLSQNTLRANSLSLSGVIVNPVANMKVSLQDPTATTGKMLFNASGNSKDCTITAVRIA